MSIGAETGDMVGVTESIREELIMLDNLGTDIQLSRVNIADKHLYTYDPTQQHG